MDDQELNLNNEMEEEDDIIVFEDDEGNEFSFQVDDYFFYNGTEYAVLVDVTDVCKGCEGGDCSTCEKDAEDDSDDGCIICEIVTGKDENGEETEEFVPVQDADLADKLLEIANQRMTEDAEEDE